MLHAGYTPAQLQSRDCGATYSMGGLVAALRRLCTPTPRYDLHYSCGNTWFSAADGVKRQLDYRVVTAPSDTTNLLRSPVRNCGIRMAQPSGLQIPVNFQLLPPGTITAATAVTQHDLTPASCVGLISGWLCDDTLPVHAGPAAFHTIPVAVLCVKPIDGDADDGLVKAKL